MVTNLGFYSSMKKLKVIIAYIALNVFTQSIYAATLEITLRDAEAKPLQDSVVYLTSVDEGGFTIEPKEEIVDQIDKQFVERIKVVTKGSTINFPNKDDIHHHVYSFSEAKKFELPLYKGVSADSVSFDKVGVVDLGCNIHDWMKAYIIVVDTPYYAKSNQNGEVLINDLPEGEYLMNIWHADSRQEIVQKNITVSDGAKNIYNESLNLAPKFKIRRAPRGRGNRY